MSSAARDSNSILSPSGKSQKVTPKDVRLNIRKTLRGAVDSQSDDDETVKLGEAVTTDSPMSRLTWEIALKAGEERIVTYRYKVCVHV